MTRRLHHATAASLVCAAVATIGAAVPSAQHSIDDLKWIVGCWSMQTSRGATITERWERSARDTLSGTSLTLRNGVEAASEVMHIFARADTIVFAALPSGQDYTEFRALSITADSVVFENAAHDFPQRVSYRIAGDSLHGRIEGHANGGFRSVDFPMRRISCEK